MSLVRGLHLSLSSEAFCAMGRIIRRRRRAVKSTLAMLVIADSVALQ